MELDKYIANVEFRLGSLLKDFKWDASDWQENPVEKAEGLVTCPIDPSHILLAKNLEAHKAICELRKLGVDPDKSVTSFVGVDVYYKGLPGVVNLPPADKEPEVQVLTPLQQQAALVQQLYATLMPPQISPSMMKPQTQQYPYQQPGGIVRLADIGDLVVEDESAKEAEDLRWNRRPLANEQVVQLENFAPLKAKRIVRRWKAIPANFRRLDWKVVEPKKMKGWLFQNIDKYSKHIEDVEDINYIYNAFVEQNDPDMVVAKLYDAVGAKTRQLVRHLWKWAVLEVHFFNYKKLTEAGKAPPEPSDEIHDEDIGLDDIDDELERLEEARRIKEAQSEPISAAMVHKLVQYEKDVAYANDIKANDPRYRPLVEMSGIFRKRERTNRPKSHLELLKEQRDYKRRRQKYRAKNVHITKRTPVQIARDLINLRMEDILVAAGVLPADEEEAEKQREREREKERERERENRDHRGGDFRGGDNRNFNNRDNYNRGGDRDNRDNYNRGGDRGDRDHRDNRDNRDNRGREERGDRERQGDRERDRGERGEAREREGRERERDRGEGRERDRGEGRERDRGEGRERDRERGERSDRHERRERDRDDHEERGDRHKERERDRSRERDRDSHKDKDRDSHRDRERDEKRKRHDDEDRSERRRHDDDREKRSRRERD